MPETLKLKDQEKMENPESLANIVFTRTAKGASACKTSNYEITRQLKSLLLVVDGQSPVSKFVPFLTNLLPLSEKFAELESMGYIQRDFAESNFHKSTLDAFFVASNAYTQQAEGSNKEQAIIAAVLREIEDFLDVNAGMEVEPIMSILQKITTLDLLKEELLAYFDLIESYDIDAGNHALKLENLMKAR